MSSPVPIKWYLHWHRVFVLGSVKVMHCSCLPCPTPATFFGKILIWEGISVPCPMPSGSASKTLLLTLSPHEHGIEQQSLQARIFAVLEGRPVFFLMFSIFFSNFSIAHEELECLGSPQTADGSKWQQNSFQFASDCLESFLASLENWSTSPKRLCFRSWVWTELLHPRRCLKCPYHLGGNCVKAKMREVLGEHCLHSSDLGLSRWCLWDVGMDAGVLDSISVYRSFRAIELNYMEVMLTA